MGLSDVLDQIKTDWEALTPPTSTSETYHAMTSERELQGASGHRGFYFALPQGGYPVLQGAGLEVVEWQVPAMLRLTNAGLGITELSKAAASESKLFRVAIHDRTTWPAGTDTVLVDPLVIEKLDDSNILVTFPLRITVGET